MARGKLILIEGLDRSGKSTQANKLVEKLPNGKLIKFPDRSTPIGSVINDYLTCKTSLSDQAAHLLFSANRWELASRIERDLLNGQFIVLDRYIYSGIAYSLAKLDIAGQGQQSPQMASLQWLYGPDKGLPKPDLTLFLTIPIQELSKRKGWGDERYEQETFQLKVRSCFLNLLNQAGDDTIHIVDIKDLNIVQVTHKLCQIIEENNASTTTNDPIKYFE